MENPAPTDNATQAIIGATNRDIATADSSADNSSTIDPRITDTNTSYPSAVNPSNTNSQNMPSPSSGLDLNTIGGITESRFQLKLNFGGRRPSVEEYALLDRKDPCFVPWMVNFPQPEQRNAIQPPITRVSRLIREESIPVFYSKNIFVAPVFSDIAYFADWFKFIGSTNRKHIKDLRLRFRLLNCAADLKDLVRWAARTSYGLRRPNGVVTIRAMHPDDCNNLNLQYLDDEDQEFCTSKTSNMALVAYKLGRGLRKGGCKGEAAFSRAFAERLNEN